ncbi:hypothetical protein PanWU01x14_230960 [Parasponia andersonii]|uniref:Uncharacterized protein n=1 Tax=Parasponia andersonii TaxID=3476 RepID=A0A2P5BKK7_PARAD|nr:hypothetical protein PanWU01x14_230960 [Parasponia andersonii]
MNPARSASIIIANRTDGRIRQLSALGLRFLKTGSIMPLAMNSLKNPLAVFSADSSSSSPSPQFNESMNPSPTHQWTRTFFFITAFSGKTEKQSKQSFSLGRRSS